MQHKRDNYYRGIEAEEIVAIHLINNGFSIVKKRWKSKYGEIDIIATNDDWLLFVEVKAKKYSIHEQEIVSRRQQLRNSKAALDFLGHHEFDNYNIRFDCAVVTNKKIANYIENAWEIISD